MRSPNESNYILWCVSRGFNFLLRYKNKVNGIFLPLVRQIEIRFIKWNIFTGELESHNEFVQKEKWAKNKVYEQEQGVNFRYMNGLYFTCVVTLS